MSFVRRFSLLVSSYYFSLILAVLYINSDFTYSYVNLYILVFTMFVLIFLSHFFFCRNINNMFAILFFPLFGLILMLVGHFLDMSVLSKVENIIKVTSFTKWIPVAATFLPFFLYTAFKYKTYKFIKKKEEMMSENKDFSKIKKLNQLMMQEKKVDTEKKDINSQISDIREELSGKRGT